MSLSLLPHSSILVVAMLTQLTLNMWYQSSCAIGSDVFINSSANLFEWKYQHFGPDNFFYIIISPLFFHKKCRCSFCTFLKVLWMYFFLNSSLSLPPLISVTDISQHSVIRPSLFKNPGIPLFYDSSMYWLLCRNFSSRSRLVGSLFRFSMALQTLM